MKLRSLAGILFLALTFFSCETNNSSESTNTSDSDEFCEYDYIVDSIGEEAVSHDCAITFIRLQELQWKWENVKSPSMIARLRATWKKDMTDAKKEIANYKGEEAQLLDSVLKEIDGIYKEKCTEYLIPAASVIGNLKSCISRVDEAKTKEDLLRFREARIGMLDELDEIHYCVEESSSQIGVVKRLAETLKTKYKEKCEKLCLQ